MRRLLLATLCAFAPAATAGGQPGADKDDMDGLRGAWQIVTRVVDGRQRNFAPEVRTVRFEGGKVYLDLKDRDGKDHKGTGGNPVKLDPARKPKEIDFGDKDVQKG